MSPKIAKQKREEQEEEDREGSVDMESAIDEPKSSRKQDEVDNGESSSSTGSSDGKGSGSGGYQADYSDQSSDDTGTGKENGTMQLGHSISGLNLNNETSCSEVASSCADGEYSHNKTVHKAHKKRNTCEGKKKASKRKSSYSVELDAIMNYKSNQDPQVAMFDENKSPLPQWNGVKISHPMDPRIDLSAVNHIQQVPVPAALATTQIPALQHPKRAPPTHHEPSHDHYMQLMEVSPWFV